MQKTSAANWRASAAWALLGIAVPLAFVGAVVGADQRLDDWGFGGLILVILGAAGAATALVASAWDH